jgi:hypothetical protein
MEVIKAVALAKDHMKNLCADEGIVHLGLEEVEFDDEDGIWFVTLSFSRSWDETAERSRKVIRFSDESGKILSVKDGGSEVADGIF